MKQFRNKVLFIENEKNLEFLKKKLLKHNLFFDIEAFYLSKNKEFNYLKFEDTVYDCWIFSKKKYNQEITLEQFKQLLKTTLKYGEKTAFITKRVPESKKEEIETKFDEILETYKKK